MEKYDLKLSNIKFHNIVLSITSKPDYEMWRYLLIEDLEDLRYDEYVVVEGFHCSCYGFDDTKWEAIKYTKNELCTLAEKRITENCWAKEEKRFYYLVNEYLRK